MTLNSVDGRTMLHWIAATLHFSYHQRQFKNIAKSNDKNYFQKEANNLKSDFFYLKILLYFRSSNFGLNLYLASTWINIWKWSFSPEKLPSLRVNCYLKLLNLLYLLFTIKAKYNVILMGIFCWGMQKNCETYYKNK